MIMESFEFAKTSINGLVRVMPFFAEDHRGNFMKSFEKDVLQQQGIYFDPAEAFYTHSAKGVLRGLHFQRGHCQDKLVQVLRGTVYDVAVDLREGSETFGKWESFYLSAENRCMLYIPKGFAHGFLALEEDTLFSYLCGDYYDPETDGGVRWDDLDIGVAWPLDKVDRVILSEKDSALPTLEEFITRYGALKGAD